MEVNSILLRIQNDLYDVLFVIKYSVKIGCLKDRAFYSAALKIQEHLTLTRTRGMPPL